MHHVNLKKKIMRRVYAIWFFKKITSPFALELISFAALLLWMTVYVSLSNVLNNVPSISSPFPAANFFISAFYETEMIVKIILIGMLALLIFLMKDLRITILRLLFRKKETLFA